MKKNFKYAMMMATALVLGFSSCSSDDNDLVEGGGSQVVEGRATQAYISIQSPATYASPQDQAATTEETKIKKVNVYIYNFKSGVLEDTKLFNLDPSETGTTDDATKVTTWELGTIQTTTGKKKMFAVANQPTSVKEDDVNTVDKLTNLAKTLTIAELASAGEFAMSSNIEEPTFKKMEDDTSGNPTVIPSDNQIALPIRRMVAKVTVKEKSSFTVKDNGDIEIEGGKLIAESGKNALSFAVGNLNATSYMAQRLLKISETPVEYQVIAPNYSNIGKEPGFGLVKVKVGTPPNEKEIVKLPEGYMEVNKSSILDNEVTAVYAPENTREEKKKGDMTYVVIKGQFIPTEIKTLNQENKWVIENPTTAATFYRIKTRDGNYFFKDMDEAKKYAKDVEKYAEGATDQDDQIKALIKTYENGYCYYTVYPNKENDYDVLRNDFYNISINKIMGLGDPTPGPQTDEDAGDVVGINTTIDVKVTIQPWQMWSEDVDLKPQA